MVRKLFLITVLCVFVMAMVGPEAVGQTYAPSCFKKIGGSTVNVCALFTKGAKLNNVTVTGVGNVSKDGEEVYVRLSIEGITEDAPLVGLVFCYNKGGNIGYGANPAVLYTSMEGYGVAQIKKNGKAVVDNIIAVPSENQLDTLDMYCTNTQNWEAYDFVACDLKAVITVVDSPVSNIPLGPAETVYYRLEDCASLPIVKETGLPEEWQYTPDE